MSRFLAKARNCCTVRTLLPKSNLGSAIRWFSISSEKKQAYTVSYLRDSLGLSSKDAISVSKIVTFVNSEKPDKTIGLLKSYGFTQTRISNLVIRFPKVLVCDPETRVLPKLEFLEGIGISVPEITRMVPLFPAILTASLENRIMPTYEFLRDFFGSEKRLIRAITRFPDLLVYDAEKYVKPNIDILRDHGVSDSNIGRMIKNQPFSVLVRSVRFRETVEQVVEMGFDASEGKFVSAVSALRSVKRSGWEGKVSAYKKCGWSEEDVLEAFKRNPLCMTISEDKIMAGLDFFVNEIGWEHQYIVKNPCFLGLSLEKRLVPRYRVFQALLSKGLVKEGISMPVLFKSSEAEFLRKYITRYCEDVVSELLKLYRVKVILDA